MIKKNILVLSSTFPHNENDTIPTFVKDQIIGLKKEYSQLSFCVIAPTTHNIGIEKSEYFEQYRYRYFFKNFKAFEKYGLMPSIRRNFLTIFVIPFFIFFQIFFTYKFIKKNKIDLIYAHWVTPQAITALVFKKFFNIPFIFTSHSQDANVLLKIPIFGRILINSILRNCENFSCVSKATYYILKNISTPNNWNEQKSLIYPMGIRDSLFENTKEEKLSYSLKNNDKVFSFIGRFTEKKGVEKLIKDFSELLKDNKNLFLTLNGSGELKNVYFSLIKSLGVENNIHISKDFLNVNQLKHIYKNSDFIVIPSIKTNSGDTEGLPVVLLEALYFGNTTISSAESNAGEIIKHGFNGFIYDTNEIDSFKNLVIKILDNQFDLIKVKNNALIEGNKYKQKVASKIYFEHLFSNI